jgi:hypothetical protein
MAVCSIGVVVDNAHQFFDCELQSTTKNAVVGSREFEKE